MPRPHRTFHGRIRGKTLRPSQRTYLEDLPRWLVPGIRREDNPDAVPLDLTALFGGRPVWLEVGFGGGEHLHALAAAHPEIGVLGVEPYVNGVATLLGKLHAQPLANVRLYDWDVRDLFDVLPPASLARAYVLYPDPWPKARHHARRFVTPDYLRPLARAMAPGAELRLATDIPDYVRQALEQIPPAGFRWLAERPDDWRAPWPGWTRTRYEAKAIREGRRPHYLRFARTGPAPVAPLDPAPGEQP